MQYGANAASILSAIAFVLLTALLVKASLKQNKTAEHQTKISQDQTDILKKQSATVEQQTAIAERQARIQELQVFTVERLERARLYDLFVIALIEAERVGKRADIIANLTNRAPEEYGARPWDFDFDRRLLEESISRAARAGGELKWIPAANQAADKYATALRELKSATPGDWQAYKSPVNLAKEASDCLNTLCSEISAKVSEQAYAINSIDKRLKQLSEAIRGVAGDNRNSDRGR
ncbi:MAG: hypothetical protein K6V73_07595 [Firmicutes bacterium]|nr:hypothetical protein [Bacillota bacterium]